MIEREISRNFLRAKGDPSSPTTKEIVEFCYTNGLCGVLSLYFNSLLRDATPWHISSSKCFHIVTEIDDLFFDIRDVWNHDSLFRQCNEEQLRIQKINYKELIEILDTDYCDSQRTYTKRDYYLRYTKHDADAVRFHLKERETHLRNYSDLL